MEKKSTSKAYLVAVLAIAVLLPYVALSSGFTLGNLDGKGWGSLLVVGIFHTGICYCLYFSSLQELPGHEVAILSYVDPLVAVLVSVIWLGEKMGVAEIIGGIFILGFTLWSEIGIKKIK